MIFGPKYPAYLEANASTLPEADLKRYKEQQQTVIEIVAKFDEPGADKEGPFTEEEEATNAERHADIVALVAKVASTVSDYSRLELTLA